MLFSERKSHALSKTFFESVTFAVKPDIAHMAYFLVHSLAVASYLALSVLYICAISGTKGSSGLASVRREQIDNNTFVMVKAGDHYSLRISRQMEPLELIFG